MSANKIVNQDVYAVVERLIKLRDLLLTSACDTATILEQMSNDYTNDENGKRQLRRDMHNLEALGYNIKRQGRPSKWALITGPHVFSDEDVQTLVHIREAFVDKHPFAVSVRQMLERTTEHLPDKQLALWQRRPALRAPLNPAIDYSSCDELIRWLENAIIQGQQIAFLYRARGQKEPILHERLDPYDIEYTDRHFYLIAFNYRYGSILAFRIDRIIQDRSRESPRPLPSRQQPRRERRPIRFTYRLPISFADGGVSERFTIHEVQTDEQFVTIQASDTSEFRIVRTLLGYGEHAVLLDGSPSLMERMRETVRLMWDNYSG